MQIQIKRTPTPWRSKWRYWLVLLIAGAGIIASFLAFSQVRQLERDRMNERFRLVARERILAIEKEMASSLEIPLVLKAFFDASQKISRKEFGVYAQSILADHPNIQALEWIPRVSRHELPRYEQAARKDGMFQFTVIHTVDQQEYYPVFYLEPLEGNEAVLGFDLASDPARWHAMQKSRDSGELQATGRISLMQISGGEAGVRIFAPVYGHGAISAGTEHLIGFVATVVRMNVIIERAIRGLQGDINLIIHDVTEATTPSLLYASTGNTQDQRTVAPYRENMEIGGRLWELTVIAQEGFFAASDTATSWGVLTVSLMVVMSLAAYLTQLIRHIGVRQHAQLQLAAREGLLHAIMENAVDGLITISEIGIVETVNPACERIFGYPSKEIIGQNIKMLMPEPYRTNHDIYLSRYRETGQAKIIGIGREVEGKRKDGSIFPLDLSISEVRYADQRIFSGSVRDISERKRLEAEREQLIQKLMVSNTQLEQFAYVCSHDLQEPLRMISNFTQRLAQHLTGKLDEKGEHFMHYITESASHARQLINDVLAFARIGSETDPIVPVDGEKILAAILSTLEERIEASGAVVTRDPLPVLRVHRTHLAQLLQNFISNALKFCGNKHPCIHIGALRQEDYWRISIQDNGIGIAPEYREKIFEIFQRLHKRNEYPGSGIGLAICKRIVQQYGGEIWLTSQPGEGTTFFFTLPAAESLLPHTGRDDNNLSTFGCIK